MTRQPISQEHFCDQVGNPAGGITTGTGFRITWQNGPMRGPTGLPLRQNGAFVEDIIQAAIGRLKYFQVGKYQCEENSRAIIMLEEALHWIELRQQDRQSRGVEGQHKV